MSQRCWWRVLRVIIRLEMFSSISSYLVYTYMQRDLIIFQKINSFPLPAISILSMFRLFVCLPMLNIQERRNVVNIGRDRQTGIIYTNIVIGSSPVLLTFLFSVFSFIFFVVFSVILIFLLRLTRAI